MVSFVRFRSLSRDDSCRAGMQRQSHCDSVKLSSQVETDRTRHQSDSVVSQQTAQSSPSTAPRAVKTRRCKRSSKAAVYAFADPLSKTSRSLNLSKLARSEFDWRTLTAIRPTTELEERFITRLVEIERLQVTYWTMSDDSRTTARYIFLSNKSV